MRSERRSGFPYASWNIAAPYGTPVCGHERARMRARTDGKLMQGAAAKVHFTPDGGSSFVHLPDGDAQRLRDLVARTKA